MSFEAGVPLGLVVRAVATGLFVLVMALLVARGRPLVAAIAIGLPVVLGPGYVLLAIDHEPAFLAQAARTGVAALAGTLALVAAVAAAPASAPAVVMASMGLAAWGATTFVGLAIAGSDAGAILFYGAALVVSGFVLRPVEGTAEKRATMPSAAALFARTVVAGGLVAAVTVLSDRLGPALSGALLTLPVGILVVAWGLKRDASPALAREVLRAARLGTLALAAFLLTVRYGAPVMGAMPAVLAAFPASIATAIAVNLARAGALKGARERASPSR